MVGATVLVVVVGAVFRLVGNDLPVRVGPALLAVAVLVGLPHGALDTVLLTEGRRPARGALVGVGYLSLAVGTWWVWSRWPFAGLCSLLAVSAAHFAAGAVQEWHAAHPSDGETLR